MGYVIKNTDTGKFVAPRGSAKSYTTAIKAQRFRSQAAAENQACGNEVVIEFETLCGPLA